MKNKISLMACGMLLITLSAWSQAGKKDEPRTAAQILNGSASNMEREFTSAAEAMPEDKWSFAPTSGEFKGVRTFAQQIKHVAAVNYMLGAALLQEKPPVDTGGESGPESLKTKADILKYLKESFDYTHKAIGTINESNLTGTVKSPFGEGTVSRLGLAVTVTSHGFDHYGQMVEYLRLNGIVPPASR